MIRSLFPAIRSTRSGRLVAPLLALALGTAPGCRGGDPAEAETDAPPARTIPVAVQILETGRAESTVRAWATIRPDQEAEIQAGLAGRVASVHVTLGQRVERGAVLLEIDPRVHAAALDEAEANAESAAIALRKSEKDLVRSEELYRTGTISDAEVETARSHTAAARATEAGSRAALERARRALGDARVLAPFAGRVAVRPPDPGTTVGIGRVLTRIVAIERVRAEAELSEQDLGLIEVGSPARLRVEAFPDRTFEGRVVAIGPQANPGSRQFPVEISAPNPDGRPLKAGMVARVEIVHRTHDDILLLPVDALVETDTGTGIYVVENGAARWRPVEPGPRTGEFIALFDGAAPGDSAVVLGQTRLADGARVSVGTGAVNWIIKTAIQKPVLVNLIMVAIVFGGLFATFTLPQEAFPDVSFPWIFVVVIDAGVSPEEIEKTITIPLEDELQDLDDLDSMISNSREGASFIWLKFTTLPEDEFALRLQDVRTEVQKVDLPANAEDPDITQFRTQDFAPLITVVVQGDIPEHDMKRLTEDLREDLLDIKHVAQIEIAGVREREVWVEVNPARLERFGVTLDEVGTAIRRKHLNLTGGDLETGRMDFRVRTQGEANRILELEDVVIRAGSDGGHIRVRDVARVSDTFEDEITRSRFNGQPAASLIVSKKQDGNSVRIIERIKEICADYEAKRLPVGARIDYINDSSRYIEDILGTLKSNAWIGMILVAISLYLFLGGRQAMFAAIGIPVALAATFLFFLLTDNTINGSTLFALVLVLGMLVDDAVVVIENCFRYIERGMHRTEAALVGTREVIAPVLVSGATTMAAFLPLMLLPGVMGDFMRVIPVGVTLALAASLFESFFILPSHIAHWSRKNSSGKPERPLIRFDRVRRAYRRLLVKCIRRRYWVIGVTTVVVLTSLFAMSVTLGVDLFADEEVPFLVLRATLPEGTRLDATDRVMVRLEDIIRETLPRTDLKNTVTTTGRQELPSEWVVKPSVGQIMIELHDPEVRQYTLQENMERIRARGERIPGLEALELEVLSSGPPTGAPVEAKIRGEHLDELMEVTAEVQTLLASIDGVKDIRDDFVEGVPELRVTVDEERAAMVGLSVSQVAGTVHTAFSGSVVTEFLDGDDDIDVVVRLDEASRSEWRDLSDLRIDTPAGNRVLLKDVARISQADGYATIKRDDNQRAITVSANVDERVISGVEASQKLQEGWPAIAARHPGYDLKFGGQFEEFVEAFNNLALLFLVGISIMLVLMAAQFNSITQPLMIFLAVIFAFWGAIMGLWIIGSKFSINNIFGLVALAGVAVNNSIVLISFVNQLREKGYGRFRAVLGAGQLRVRPILLTSLTTVVGLIPMAVGLGGYSVVWGPLATIMVCGLVASSVLSLFLIPSVFIVSGDIKRFLLGRRVSDETAAKRRYEDRRRRRRELAGVPQMPARGVEDAP